MRTRTQKTRLTLDLSRTEYKKLQTAAENLGMTMQELVVLSVNAFFFTTPNETTLRAMRQSASGKGLKRFAHLDELLQDLEL